MAIGLANYPNIVPPDADYPGGRIKDDTGVNDGTPVNALVNNDLHETLDKFLREANLTPNGIPDNEYSGHQYYQAMREILSDYRKPIPIFGFAQTTIIDSEEAPVVIYRAEAPAGHLISLDKPTGNYQGIVKVVNLNNANMEVYTVAFETINGAAVPFTVGSGQCAEFKYNASTDDWDLQQYYKMW